MKGMMMADPKGAQAKIELPSLPQGVSPATQQENNTPWHLFFGGMLAITLVVFALWSKDYVGNASWLILGATIIFAFFMAFNIGGNDVANSFGTSVGAGTLSLKQALVIAAIFEVSGAVIAGGEVTDTVRSGIVDLNAISGLDPLEFAYIMMASLLGAATWLLLATRMGWPVSTTHSIVGGIVGAALAVGFITGKGGWSMVQWGQVGQIAISWVLSPVLGGIVSYILFRGIKSSILSYNEAAEIQLEAVRAQKKELKARHRELFEQMSEKDQKSYTNALTRDLAAMREEDWEVEDLESSYFKELHQIQVEKELIEPRRAIETWIPLLAAGGSLIISGMMLFKGLKNLHLGMTNVGNLLIMGMIAAVVYMSVYIFSRTMKKKNLERSTFLLFSWMQVFTASAFAFSHGSNDIANALGPFVAVLDVLKTGAIVEKSTVPVAVMVSMGIALIAGLWFIGRYVIRTVGSGLTEMHPASGFSAELSAAAVVMGASLLGLPVSSTHILIGAVLGIGMVNRNTDWGLMKPIGLAWVLTLPVSAAIAAATVSVIRLIF
ncbi:MULTISPECIES: inorganic phosphate transporter [Trueperella]|uniref:Phosphate transporter n=3 Tax=Trueperella bernardiae TaxID=59561 RepID=A0AAW6ZKL2_9ACTO|nr:MULTISPECIES: inorganic phosphate transporter [Trueperella]MCM3907834.1 inorganic phosphate transporter [Trueperella bernardiae]MDK8602442.1 anion permease [Trueperella bernardiae]WIM07646.1 anion permease [Trueperella bernardiae]